MAIITRRYTCVGPGLKALQNYVSLTGATLGPRYPGSACDIQIDDSIDGIIPTINEYMTKLGWVFDSTFIPGAAHNLVWTWGTADIGVLATTLFLPPGRGLILDADVAQIPVGRQGTLQNLYVRHNSAGVGASLVTYTVMVNAIATAITATLSTGSVGQTSDVVNSVLITAGSTVSIRADIAGAIASGLVNPQVSLEFV